MLAPLFGRSAVRALAPLSFHHAARPAVLLAICRQSPCRPPLTLGCPAASMASSAQAADGSAAATAAKVKVKKSNVYTRTGDKGTSVLYNMTRIEKENGFFEALGDSDELNASLGVAREHCTTTPGTEGLHEHLVEIQSRLLDVGSAIATPTDGASTAAQLRRVHFDEANVVMLEGWIDAMDAQLPKLTNFILPSGGACAAQLHVARTVCRRAERRVAPLAREGLVQNAVAVYLNRLSDFLFVAARFAAMKSGAPEIVYKKARVPKQQPAVEAVEATAE